MKRMIAFVVATAALAACATPTRTPDIPVSVEIVPDREIRIGTPSAIVEPYGTRLHGWLCRATVTAEGTHGLRAERLSDAGEVVDTFIGKGTLPRSHGCAIYDVRTDWKIQPGERLRICDDRGRACTPGARP